MTRRIDIRPSYESARRATEIMANAQPQPSKASRLIRHVLLWSLVSAARLSVAGPANADWERHERRGQIEVFSEFGIDVDFVLTELQSVADEIRQKLELPPPARPIQIILFSSARGYRTHLANSIPESARRRAIFYRNGDVFQIYAYRSQALITDLRHEFTHALLHQALPYVPLWMDEGLAEYFEEAPDARAASQRLAGTKWKSRMGWTPGLKRLEQIPSADQMDADDYRDSWAWITYLMNGSPASRELLKTYLLAVSAGEAPGSFNEWAITRQPLVIKGVGSYFRRFQISLR
ncbi:MAG: hypothetical protein R3C19_08015 [Planctomycetaceae bacterium]